MSVTSVIQGDKAEIGAVFWQPFKIVSLWDMYELSAEPFTRIFGSVLLLGRIVEDLRHEETEDDLKPDKRINEVLALFDEKDNDINKLRESLLEMGLSTSANAACRFINRPRDGDGRSRMKQAALLADHFIFTLSDDLKGRNFMVIPAPEVEYYDKPDRFFPLFVQEALSAVDHDMIEACKCFALDRHTACVFHLMRVMEQTVQRMGRRFKIKDLHKKTWGQILGETKHKIDKLKNRTPQQLKRKARYSDFYDKLDAVNRATRTSAMHSRITEIRPHYSGEEAKDMIDRVASFLQDFVTLK